MSSYNVAVIPAKRAAALAAASASRDPSRRKRKLRHGSRIGSAGLSTRFAVRDDKQQHVPLEKQNHSA
jgi:hypothetical protein